MKIYAVVGEYGAYSGRFEWIVCAYRDPAKAEQHSKDAESEARMHWRLNAQDSYLSVDAGYNKFDSTCSVIDEDDPCYSVTETELLD